MVRHLQIFLITAVSAVAQTYDVSWPSQSSGNGGFFSPDGLEVRQDGTALKVNPYNGVFGGINGGVVTFQGSYSYLPDQSVESDGNGGWQSTDTDFHLIIVDSGGSAGNGSGGGSSSISIAGEWIRGNGIVYDISETDDQGWFYIADRTNGGYGELYFRFVEGSETDLQVGTKNNQGIINPSNGTTAQLSDDGEYRRISLDFPNGSATWTQASGHSGGGGGNNGGVDGNQTAEQALAAIQGQFNQIINIQNGINGQIALLNQQVAGLDPDADVPTLEQILQAIEELESTFEQSNSNNSSSGSSVVQGTRNQDGDFEDLEERLEEMDIQGQLQAEVDKIDSEGMNNLLGSSNQLEDGLAEAFNGVGDLPSFEVHMPFLEKRSPLADYGTTIDLMNVPSWGEEFGIPSLEEMAAWLKACVYCMILVMYVFAIRAMMEWYVETDVKSTPSAPITNYGGSLGGIINTPMKIANGVAIPGILTAGIAIFTTWDTIEGESIWQTLNVAYAAAFGIGTGYVWLAMACEMIDAFIPTTLALQLVSYYWTIRTALLANLWIKTYTGRALS